MQVLSCFLSPLRWWSCLHAFSACGCLSVLLSHFEHIYLSPSSTLPLPPRDCPCPCPCPCSCKFVTSWLWNCIPATDFLPPSLLPPNKQAQRFVPLCREDSAPTRRQSFSTQKAKEVGLQQIQDPTSPQRHFILPRRVYIAASVNDGSMSPCAPEPAKASSNNATRHP